MPFIDPIRDFGSDLYSIQKPARYLGGEVGSHNRISPTDERLKVALCFPDLYEIGMSNNAIRILYNDIGKMSDDIVCERVFAPAPDFEDLLKRRGIPLYTLESGIPLKACDIIGFSIGYELLATNILTVLDTGMIPLLSKDRGEDDPVILAGGPASTNPHPFGAFLDAVYIGEAEAEFFPILRELAALKKAGAGRSGILERLRTARPFWMPGSPDRTGKPASRAVFSGFSSSTASTAYPIPIIQAVQSHGTVEIMRGCPNGCRFCHAGYYYRPQRIKAIEHIEDEVKSLVENGGYREITLASLSSGDYPDIVGLFQRLNARWKGRFVSFQLPSLKVDSFTLPLLAELSEVRKSGLTFAVETPIESWQGSINKMVSFDKIAGILREAKQLGFRSAKFYFMIGLPVSGKGLGEGKAIVDFLLRISQAERIALNVNIGTFVPKPHTPYARESQIGEKESLETIYYIKDALRHYKYISISYHSPFTSVVEGILSRGDDRVGEIILSAYSRGARLDAWEEHFRKDIWKEVFEDTLKKKGFNPAIEYLTAKNEDSELPWDDINIFVSKTYLTEESEKSFLGAMTGGCTDECDHPCGSCNDTFQLVSNIIPSEVLSAEEIHMGVSVAGNVPLVPDINKLGFIVGESVASSSEDGRLVVSFKKERNASFYPLHSISGIFTRAFFMLGLPVRYTEGFNPLPRMELSQPLALGIVSCDDIMAVWLESRLEILNSGMFAEAFNMVLPEGIVVSEIRLGKSRAEGKNSIGSLYWGSLYEAYVENLADYRAIEHLVNEANVHESVEFDVSERKIKIFLNDAHGGEHSIIKLLSKALKEDKVLDHCTIKRVSSLVMSGDGLQRLFNAL